MSSILLSTALQGMGLGNTSGPLNWQLLLDQPKDKIVVDENGISMTRTYLTYYNAWLANVWQLYGGNPIYVSVALRRITCTQIEEMGELCFVEMYYDQRYASSPTTAMPQAQHGVNADRKILPITLHPNFIGGVGSWDAHAPWSQFWDASKKDWQSDATGAYLSTVPGYLIGWTQFPDAAATVWTKTYYESEPTDPLPENQIIDPGFGYGPSGCYVCASADQQKENAFWCRTLHFEYWPRGAPTFIFQRG